MPRRDRLSASPRETRDSEKWKNLGAKGGADETADFPNPHEETPGSLKHHEGYENSRGGTRTRDPGIMSAVL